MLSLKMDVSREQICGNRNTKDAIVSFYMQKYKSDKSHQVELQAVFNANSGASRYTFSSTTWAELLRYLGVHFVLLYYAELRTLGFDLCFLGFWQSF